MAIASKLSSQINAFISVPAGQLVVPVPPLLEQSSFPEAARSRRSLWRSRICCFSSSDSAVHGQSVGSLLEHVVPEYDPDAHDDDDKTRLRSASSAEAIVTMAMINDDHKEADIVQLAILRTWRKTSG